MLSSAIKLGPGQLADNNRPGQAFLHNDKSPCLKLGVGENMEEITVPRVTFDNKPQRLRSLSAGKTSRGLYLSHLKKKKIHVSVKYNNFQTSSLFILHLISQSNLRVLGGLL